MSRKEKNRDDNKNSISYMVFTLDKIISLAIIRLTGQSRLRSLYCFKCFVLYNKKHIK